MNEKAGVALRYTVAFCGMLALGGGIGVGLKKLGMDDGLPGYFICETDGQASTLMGGITSIRSDSSGWIRLYSEDYGPMLYRPGERETCIMRVVSEKDLGAPPDGSEGIHPNNQPSRFKL